MKRGQMDGRKERSRCEGRKGRKKGRRMHLIHPNVK